MLLPESIVESYGEVCTLQIINQFFDKIIRIVHFWGGDIIKFSGDALTVVWPVDDEEEEDRREAATVASV